jgi:hypothetical protein
MNDIKIINKSTNVELKLDEKLSVKILMDNYMIQKLISQQLYGFVFTSMIHIEIEEQFIKKKNKYETIIYYTDFIDNLLKINTEDEMKNIKNIKIYNESNLDNYLKVLYINFLKNKKDDDAIKLIQSIEKNPTYIKTQYENLKKESLNFLKSIKKLLTNILDGTNENVGEDINDIDTLIDSVCKLISRLNIDNKNIDRILKQNKDISNDKDEKEEDEKEEDENDENDENDEDEWGNGDDDENDEDEWGNGDDDENDEDEWGNGDDDENDEDEWGNGDEDENDEDEWGNGDEDENDEDEWGNGDEDEKEEKDTGEDMKKRIIEPINEIIDIIKNNQLIMIVLLRRCEQKANGMKYIISNIYEQFTENKNISEYEDKYKKQLSTINDISLEYLLYYFTLKLKNLDLDLNDIFYSIKSSNTIPFSYFQQESKNQNINIYKIYNLFMRKSMTLKWALQTKSIRKDGIYSKFKLNNNNYVDIKITNENIFFQNNVSSYDEIFLYTNIKTNHCFEETKHRRHDINLSFPVESKFDVVILCDLIMNNSLFNNNLFVSDNYSSDINYYPGTYIDSLNNTKYDFKIYSKQDTVLFNIKKIGDNSLLRFKIMIKVLLDEYNNMHSEIEKYYKKLGYTLLKGNKLKESYGKGCQKGKFPIQSVITLDEFNKLKEEKDSYVDKLNNIVNSKYYVINEDDKSYKKISCPNNYIGIYDKKRNSISDFCCYKTQQITKPGIDEQVKKDQISYEEFTEWKKINKDKFRRDVLNNFITDTEYIDINPTIDKKYNKFVCNNNNCFIAYTNTVSKTKIRESIYDFKSIKRIYDSTSASYSQVQNKKTFPLMLSKLFNICDIDDYSIITTDTDVPNEHTFGECMKNAGHDLVKTLNTIFKGKDFDYLKRYYESICYQDCTKTSLYDFKAKFLDKNIDEHFKTLFEYVSRCNIIIFDLNTYQIHLPEHTNGYYVNFLYRHTIILFYDSKKNRYHLFKINDKKYKKQIHKIDNSRIIPIIKYYNKFIFNLNLYNITNFIPGKQTKYIINSQYIDSSGKVRALSLNYNNKHKIYIETSPLQPLSVFNEKTIINTLKITNDHVTHVDKFIKELFNLDTKKQFNTDGQYYEWNVNNISFKLYKYKRYNNSSKLVNFIYQKEFSNCLKEHALWLYSLNTNTNVPDLFRKRSEIIRNIDLAIINKRNQIQSDMKMGNNKNHNLLKIDLLNFKKERESLDKKYFNKILDNEYNYTIKNDMNPFIYEGKIVIDDDETEKKLKYIIDHEIIRNKKQLIKYKDETNIRNFKNIRNKKNKINSSFLNNLLGISVTNTNREIIIDSYEEIVQYLMEKYLEQKNPLGTQFMF